MSQENVEIVRRLYEEWWGETQCSAGGTASATRDTQSSPTTHPLHSPDSVQLSLETETARRQASGGLQVQASPNDGASAAVVRGLRM